MSFYVSYICFLSVYVLCTVLYVSILYRIFKMNEDIPNISQAQIEFRRKQWEALFEKYEKQSEVNTEAYYGFEINYKMFLKPPSKKMLKLKRNKRPKGKKRNRSRNTQAVDFDQEVNKISESTVSSTVEVIDSYAHQIIDDCDTVSVDSGVEMIDEAVEFPETNTSSPFVNIDAKLNDDNDVTLTEMSNLNDEVLCSQVHSTENDCLQKLIHFIEIELNSNLKTLLKQRDRSKLLDFDDYNYWHECTKREMTRLENYISRNNLREYMKHCYSADIPKCINDHIIHNVISHQLKSNIKKLFLKREFSRHDKDKYLKYRKRVFVEWQRLSEVIPLDYLLSYGDNILFCIEKLKSERRFPMRN
ncbi:uncharacterized protein LOC108914926 [Anoplophora glabripennis]|uniref:uncharacterized protein LOC108914926 n=1 Tax=Anoplophora glabripennis TaxID=217634 RepID=UPI0008747D10|nr:uncharacterized protein LOC108914926 [Anoplophora glabripennis]